MSSSALIVLCPSHHTVPLMFVEFMKFIFRGRTSLIEILFGVLYYDPLFGLLYYDPPFELRYSDLLLGPSYYDLWSYGCVMYVKS